MNVQVGALANVVIMLCITLWALYLIFHNKAVITQGLIHGRPLTRFLCLFIRAFALVWHWLACAYCGAFSVRPGQQPEIHDGRHPAKPAIIGGAALVSGILSRWIAKTITLSPATQRNYPELQKRLNGWISASLKAARILTVCVAIMLLLSAWGLFDFREWLHNDAGQNGGCADPHRPDPLLLRHWLDGSGQPDCSAGIGYSWPSAAQRAGPDAADAVSQRAGGGDQHHHGDDPALEVG